MCDFSGAFLDPELLGVGSLLKKYIALLCTHIGDILPVAISIASTGCRHFAEVSRVIEGDLTGKKKKKNSLRFVFPAYLCFRDVCNTVLNTVLFVLW